MMRFGVFLETPSGEKRYETFDAEGRHLAAKAAEAMHPGSTVVAVTARYDVAGRCGRCEGIIFRDEKPRETPRGLRCLDC